MLRPQLLRVEQTRSELVFGASGMLERKTVKYKFKVTAVALANKVARIVFVLMTRGGRYDGRHPAHPCEALCPAQQERCGRRTTN